ncbi:TPA: molybdopterin-guanine dinucleotide biosynthesis protein MobA, partial [Klebsiella pneumoniae]|nr:molybdopterin-guanine dinucleotide biosynthesis protein MobA [Klebsiella pneumoniae]
SEEHDKRIAENYVFDEVLGRSIPRTEYEKKAKFNQDDYKPTPDEINRFPSRQNNEHNNANRDMGLNPSIHENKKYNSPQLRPSSYRINK